MPINRSEETCHQFRCTHEPLADPYSPGFQIHKSPGGICGTNHTSCGPICGIPGPARELHKPWSLCTNRCGQTPRLNHKLGKYHWHILQIKCIGYLWVHTKGDR